VNDIFSEEVVLSVAVRKRCI